MNQRILEGNNANDVENDPENDTPELVSAFPKPPAFFQLYADSVEMGPPPPKPMSPSYYMFGTLYSTKDTVTDLVPDAAKKVYDSTKEGFNLKTELKKINKSLLANFIELINVLISEPTKFNEKVNDMEQLFLNMHNLINDFRPHQAREMIIEMLKNQIESRKQAKEEIIKSIEEANASVNEAHAELARTNQDNFNIEDINHIAYSDETEKSDKLSNDESSDTRSEFHLELFHKLNTIIG